MAADSNPAVFLSYASQDAAAAKLICEALRAAGIEVWFDQSELRGGDAWDRKIRGQIRECRLFLPVISAHSDARTEGYFRLEWKLAVDRSHLMSEDTAFIVPVVIDGTSDAAARVPDKFREVQWTRLPNGATPAAFCAQVHALLAGARAAPVRGTAAPPASRRGLWVGAAFGAFGVVALALMFGGKWRRTEARGGGSAGTAMYGMGSPATAPKSEARQKFDQAYGIYQLVDSNVDDFNTAESLLQRALELDQSDGEIWALSALVNRDFYTRGFDLSPDRWSTASSQVERAVKLAPNSALAAFAHGRVLQDSGDSEAELKRALALAPPHGWLHSRSLYALGMAEHGLESIPLLEQSIDPEVPGSDALAHYNEFLRLFTRREFPEADAKVALAASELPSVNFVCGRAQSLLTWRGDTAGAAAALATLTPERRREPRAVLFGLYTALLSRKPKVALQILDTTPITYLNDNYYSGAIDYWRAMADSELGDTGAAAVMWERAYDECLRHDAGKPPEQRMMATEAEILGWLGRTADAHRLIAALDAETIIDWRGGAVRAFAALGDADKAVARIKQHLTDNNPYSWPLTPALLRLDPLWDKLRQDPRFKALADPR